MDKTEGNQTPDPDQVNLEIAFDCPGCRRRLKLHQFEASGACPACDVEIELEVGLSVREPEKKVGKKERFFRPAQKVSQSPGARFRMKEH